jgi:hypothetical protein
MIGGAVALDRFASALRASGTPSGLVEAAQYLLPPAHVVAALREPFARGQLVEPAAVAWPLAFGTGSLVVAILVLHRRPFRS